MSSSRHPLVAPAAMPGALNQNEDGDFRHGRRLDRKISLRSRNAMNDDALNRGCCNSQNMVAAMSVRESHLHEPESCICPMCKRVMRLSRVPALKQLDTTEFYFRCDDCDYISAQLTEFSAELVCEVIRG
jgi:predicted  nucleic acid-binding Zn ribbon protein